jgi:hypothetical protein
MGLGSRPDEPGRANLPLTVAVTGAVTVVIGGLLLVRSVRGGTRRATT